MNVHRNEMDPEKQDAITIDPIGELDAELPAPPSKAHTLRGLFIASLAEGQTKLLNSLQADDQKYAAEALSSFGATINFRDGDYVVEGMSLQPGAPGETVYTGQSGVTSRFIIPVAALTPGRTVIDADEQMRSRPMGDLVDALSGAGVRISSRDGHLPIEVYGNAWEDNAVTVSVDESSQYVSALLISAPGVEGGLTVHMDGELRSAPYVAMTEQVMDHFGVPVEHPNEHTYRIPPDHSYEARTYSIEGDYSSASYFLAAAAVTGGRLLIRNLREDSLQGDREIVSLLSRMGCDVTWTDEGIEITGDELTGITADMSDVPDLVPTLSVVAAFSKGTTRIENVGHLAYKESDRLQSISRNLSACGIDHTVTEEAIEIRGGTPEPATIDPAGDHRIAMAFAIMGLEVPGMTIDDPHVVRKSFPDFFQVLESLYG